MSVRVVFNYGGTFVEDPIIKYVGGSVDIIENVTLDYISLLGLNEYHFQLNPAPNVNLYFLVPGYEVWEGGAVLLRDDKDVIDMVEVLLNEESEEVVLFGVQMEGPLQVVGLEEDDEDDEDVVEIDKHTENDKGNQTENENENEKVKQTATNKGNQTENKKGKQTANAKGKQIENAKKHTKQSMKRNKNQGSNEHGEEADHPSWMDEDLEGPGDDDIFEEGPKKTEHHKVQDVFVEDWWNDDEGDGKEALRKRFVLSDDEDNLEGDDCMEFNEDTDMGTIDFEVGMEFTNHTIFRKALVEFSVKGGFDIKYIQNDRKRITARCKAKNCTWRIHASVK